MIHARFLFLPFPFHHDKIRRDSNERSQMDKSYQYIYQHLSLLTSVRTEFFFASELRTLRRRRRDLLFLLFLEPTDAAVALDSAGCSSGPLVNDASVRSSGELLLVGMTCVTSVSLLVENGEHKLESKQPQMRELSAVLTAAVSLGAVDAVMAYCSFPAEEQFCA